MARAAPDRRLEELLREKREEILALAERHGAVNVRLFGSLARGAADGDSDVDFLVDFSEPARHGSLDRLTVELEVLLGCRVDVVPASLLVPLLRPAVLASAIPLDRPLPYIPPADPDLVVKDDRLYLHHILRSIEALENIAARGIDAFVSDRILQDAALRNLQTMAESTQRLSVSAKARHPEIDWEEIRASRNRIAHGYLDLDMSEIWKTMRADLPSLRDVATELLKGS
jgi:uncharacterized protein